MARFTPVPFLIASIASPAVADLSALEAWQAFQTSNSAVEGFIWDDASEAGGVVTVEGARFETQSDEGDVSFRLGTLTFTELGDGTVSLGLPASMPLAINARDEFGGEITITGSLETQAGSAIYSGRPEDLTVTYAMESMGLVITDLSELPDNAEFDLSVTASGIAGVVTSQGTGPLATQFEGTIASIDYVIDAVEPEEGKLAATFTMRDVTSTGRTIQPLEALEATELLSNENFLLEANLSSAGTAIAMSIEDADGGGQFNATTGPGDLEIRFGEGQMGYSGTASALAITVLAPGVPIPVNVGLESYDYDFAMPLVMTEDDADFRLALGLRGLTIDDFIWNIIDPGTVLPRDPATIALALSGKGRWLLDILDTAATAELDGDEFPGEFSSATIEGIEVAAAGARLTGSGAFTFDNTDLFTFDGFPAPSGELDVALSGGNGLLDKLVQMGLLPQEQAMAGRMMMGLFMVPGEGPDELTSKITVDPSGSVFANGQQLR